MKNYMSKAELARYFGISSGTVYKRVSGIEAEIEKGRYNRYAIADGLISTAVFVDYAKYHKRLNDRNLRRTVPAFNINEAQAYLMEMEGKSHIVAGAEEKRMIEDFVRLKKEEKQSWQAYMETSRIDKLSDAAREAYEGIRRKYITLALVIANSAAESLTQGKRGN